MNRKEMPIGVSVFDSYTQRYYIRQHYPCITNLAGLKLIDYEAWDKFVKGITDSKHVEMTMEEASKLRFALTPRKGWDCDFGSPLGYNPITRYWTFYEYFEYDGYDIFGFEGHGAREDDAIPLWEFPEVANAQADA